MGQFSDGWEMRASEGWGGVSVLMPLIRDDSGPDGRWLGDVISDAWVISDGWVTTAGPIADDGAAVAGETGWREVGPVTLIRS